MDSCPGCSSSACTQRHREREARSGRDSSPVNAEGKEMVSCGRWCRALRKGWRWLECDMIVPEEDGERSPAKLSHPIR